MAVAYKTQQVVGTAATSTYSTLYSTGASTTAVVSAITVCNEAATSVTVRVGLAASATTPASGAFLVFDSVIAANDTVVINMPLTMGNTTFLRVSSSAITCSFTASVGEVS